LAYDARCFGKAEGVASITRAEAEQGLSLLGFGIDSLVEVASATLVLRLLLLTTPDAKTRIAGSSIFSGGGANSGGGGGGGGGGNSSGVGNSGGQSSGGCSAWWWRRCECLGWLLGAPAGAFGDTDEFRVPRAGTLFVGSLLLALAVGIFCGAVSQLASKRGPSDALSGLIISSIRSEIRKKGIYDERDRDKKKERDK